jgi:cyclopropane fatty-acyl-phospholipid synthase-like methyltransferase
LRKKGYEEIGEWRSYWESLSDRCQLFREQANEYVRRLEAALPLESNARVLDFGCGFGFVAAILAPRVGEVFLWDASSNMRQRARVNVAGQPNIRFVDLSEPRVVATELRFDLILVNSVVQYMTHDDFSAWLALWRDMLGPKGRVVVSDLIPPTYPSSSDIVDLLRFSARRRILARAIWQLFGDLWRYWRVRRVCSLTRIGREDLSRLGQTAGFVVSFLPMNLTHFTKRCTAVFTRAVHDQR